MNAFVVKGDICWSSTGTELNTVHDGYLVCADSLSAGVFRALPKNTLPFLCWTIPAC